MNGEWSILKSTSRTQIIAWTAAAPASAEDAWLRRRAHKSGRK